MESHRFLFDGFYEFFYMLYGNVGIDPVTEIKNVPGGFSELFEDRTDFIANRSR